ncbi:MAG: glycyl-radical enzyme activating protein [Clostridiales bacterium]|nr:glycyl-radical enzyme activating protein [Clostridiales bacterium]
MQGIITDVQRFCVHDGPGIRTTVFFKGCPLRCQWCHNPETQRSTLQPQLSRTQCVLCGACAAVCGRHAVTEKEHLFNSRGCVSCMKCVNSCAYGALRVWGRTADAQELVAAALEDAPFYGNKGGITLSGGEPTMQADFCAELLRQSKEHGLNTCLETSGAFDAAYLERIAPYTDHVLLDFKDGNAARLRRNTGQDLERLTEVLLRLDQSGIEYQVRSIIIAGVNDSPGDIRLLQKYKRMLKHCSQWRLFSYHSLGRAKGEQLGIKKQKRFEPVSQEHLATLTALLNE